MSERDTRKKRWSILYRGPLSSCNYACDYCPFAKTRNTRAELEEDARKLARFVDWVARRDDRDVGVLFTPWGEALIRRHYRDAMVRLSHMPHVYRVAAQTNLSFRSFDWLEASSRDALALWTTWHPTQISLDDFLERCARLDARGVRYSVGVVGLRESFEAIEELRARLAPEIYLWINAYKREPSYYDEQDVQRLERVDPLFRYNTRYHPSQGRPCQAGVTAFTVDGDGVARRCHFIDAPIGNIHDEDFDEALYQRPCAIEACGCHIGYVHLDALELYPVFGDGLMERIPSGLLWRDDEAREAAIARARARLGEHRPVRRPACFD